MRVDSISCGFQIGGAPLWEPCSPRPLHRFVQERAQQVGAFMGLIPVAKPAEGSVLWGPLFRLA